MSSVQLVSDLQNRLIVSSAQFSVAAISDANYIEAQKKLDEFLPARVDILDSFRAAYDGIRMTAVSTWFGLGASLQLPTDKQVQQAESMISYGNRLIGEIKKVMSNQTAERIDTTAAVYEAEVAKVPITDPDLAGQETFARELASREAALTDKLTGGGVAGLLFGKGTVTMILVGIVLAFIALAFLMFMTRAILG